MTKEDAIDLGWKDVCLDHPNYSPPFPHTHDFKLGKGVTTACKKCGVKIKPEGQVYANQGHTVSLINICRCPECKIENNYLVYDGNPKSCRDIFVEAAQKESLLLISN